MFTGDVLRILLPETIVQTMASREPGTTVETALRLYTPFEAEPVYTHPTLAFSALARY